MNTIEILDTTLRDGAQGEGISFSVQDKLAIVQALDSLGVSWIEAGNPGSNPKDMEFFQKAGKLTLEHSRLAAFGSTRKKGVAAAEDRQVQSLLDANTPGVVIFGKSWDLHVTEVLRVSLEENIAMIAETIAFLKQNGRAVIYDAEHFFDGLAANPDYALSTLKAALDAGADRLALCDTNGGTFPDMIADGVKRAAALLPSSPLPCLGIHAHNDSGMAAANSLLAVKAGCCHVQGTLLGFGERCGNAALAEIIPSLELKMGARCLPEGKLEQLLAVSRTVAEIANIAVPDTMPYVGASAFSHKAGMHADGILKISRSFEHIDPALVGNGRRFLMSEVGGRAAIAERAKKIEPSITKDHPVTAALAERLKKLEAEGWQFEGADGSFEILVRRELGRYKSLFAIEAYRVVSENPAPAVLAAASPAAPPGALPAASLAASPGASPGASGAASALGADKAPGSEAYCHAWAKVLVDGKHEIAAAEGDGPVNALDGALRRALKHFYPELEQVRLSDYKVRVIDGKEATAAKVRVLIESTDGVQSWTTVGVSTDIIDASRAALVDSIEYKLIADIERRFKAYL